MSVGVRDSNLLTFFISNTSHKIKMTMMALSCRSTMFGRYYSLLTVLTLLIVSPVPTKAFWNRDKKEQASDGVAAANVANDSNGIKPTETPVDYGVDVSFPMHHSRISNNYAWLPHNVDPVHHDIPPKYKDMPVQPLGDRQTYYDEFLNGCKEKWGASGAARCQQNEDDRIAMTLRQPQSMQVRNFMSDSSQYVNVKRDWHVFVN